MHRRSTILPHLFNSGASCFAKRLVWRLSRVAIVVLSLATGAGAAPLQVTPNDRAPSVPVQQPADTALYRIFLGDGATLVSYGEFARVGDRVVLSIPVGELTGAGAPNLQLVSIPQSAVDWDRTNRYSEAVRARRYAETRGEADFAILGARVVEALNQISSTDDPARRLAMAQEARQNLSRWPADNFGYRARDVAQLTGMLDDVISELRVAAGLTNRVSLAATTVPPEEPPLAPPDFRETMEQAMTVAALTPDPGERISLLRGIALALRNAPSTDWGAVLSVRAAGELSAELRVEKAYNLLASSTLAAANARAALGDLRGVQGLVERVLQADDRLGRKRPQNTSALLAALEWRLGEAARVRQARDAWAVRQTAFTIYRHAIDRAVQELRDARKALVAIRERSGPAALVLPRMEQRLVMGKQMLAVISPPAELDAAHGIFRAAFQMAIRAASDRRNAISSNNTKLAWDAASAAAGALMLLDRAVEELDRLSSPSTGH
ncbi:MAG: hypothetical protein V7647_1321 [Acidobacteriota bacterium]